MPGRRSTLASVASHSSTLMAQDALRRSLSRILYTGLTRLWKKLSSEGTPRRVRSASVSAHVSSLSSQWNHRKGMTMRCSTSMGSLLVKGVTKTHSTKRTCSTQHTLASRALRIGGRVRYVLGAENNRARPARRKWLKRGGRARAGTSPAAVAMAPSALACSVIDTPLVAAAAAPAGSPLPLKRASDNRHVVRVVERGDWPTSTSTLCWYCCHPFDGPPLPLPLRYDDRRDVWHVIGTFCSWACMKSYNLDSSSYMRHVNSTYITLLHKRCTGRLEGIRPAPPRLTLKAFGGTLSIEEFRGTDKQLELVPPRMIVHRPVVEEIPARLRERPTHQQMQDSVSFKDATAQNDMLRLRRPKPLTSHNLLVRTMGVQILGSSSNPPPPS